MSNELDEAIGLFMGAVTGAAKVFVESVRDAIAKQTSEAVKQFFLKDAAAPVEYEAKAEPAAPRKRRVTMTDQIRRTKGDLSKRELEFAGFVKAHPGLRIEEINRQLGTTTAELRLPIKRAIASGTVVMRGTKRSARYFPGKKARK